MNMFLSLAFASAAQSFLVMGDMPYTPLDEVQLAQPNGQLASAVAQSEHGFLLHLGDIKSGSLPCTNALLERNKALLSALSPQPFVYTPGDNEWTDCDRHTLTPQFDELERLDYIKALMFDEAYFLKAKQLSHFSSQENRLENARWQFADIEFMTLHIPGTFNGRSQILKSDVERALNAADERDQDNLAWLQQGLNNTQAKAYVIGFQADIYNKTNKPSCNQSRRQECDAFKLYRDAIAAFAANTNKPVLVMHGDTGPYCTQALSKNLTRLNVPGDFMVSDISKVSLVDNRWHITTLSTGQVLSRECQ